MHLKVKQLKDLIKESILESAHYREVRLTDGEICEYGDEKHISDMESLVAGLETLRDQQRRTSASRLVYADAVKQLKQEIKKFRKKHVVHELDVEYKPKVGFDGGQATTPGHGRYSPGED